MKLCQCCGQTAEDDTVTCPKCGEASWGTLVVKVDGVELPVESIEIDTKQPKGKRR